MMDFKHRDPRSMRGDYLPPRHHHHHHHHKHRRSALGLAALAAFVLVYGWIGAEDHKETQRAERHYCEMVQAGNWPAYKPAVKCDKPCRIFCN